MDPLGLLPILDKPQFTRADALAVTGISDGQLKGILDRKQVWLRDDHNPGTGRRRLFCGSDLVKLTVANTLSTIGVPMRWASVLADQVERRADALQRGLDLEGVSGLGFAMYPVEGGADYLFERFHDGDDRREGLPDGYQVILVDRLISNVLAKLHALVADEPIPTTFTPPTKPAPPGTPENDIMGAWTKDEGGQAVYCGLTAEETAECLSLERLWLADRTQAEDQPRTAIITDAEGDRLSELQERRHVAMMRRTYTHPETPASDDAGLPPDGALK